MQLYQQPDQQVYYGFDNVSGNPDDNLCGKVSAPNFRLLLVISARLCPAVSSGNHPAPSADPSLPTTEEGISARGCKTTTKNGGRSELNLDNSKTQQPFDIMRALAKIMSIENTNTTGQKASATHASWAEATKVKPTDRDRQLIGVLGVVRYLSSEQLCRLFYAGRNIQNMRKRLLRFAGEGALAFKPVYFKRLFYRTYEGQRCEIWTVTGAGYAVASTVLGTIIKIPRHDVGAAFREHAIALNELFVALTIPPSGGYPRAKQSEFRWIPSDAVRLPWRQNLGPGSKSPDRLVLPDAVLEVPRARRRYFLECEMGTHPIQGEADPRPGSTIAKVQNYDGFLGSYVDARATQTFYARSFPDNYVPEVLFLVRTPHRANAVNDAIAQWRQRCGTRACASRALTVEDARDYFLGILRSGSKEQQKSRPPASDASLCPEEIATVRQFYNATVLAFKELRAKARARGETPPAYPAMVEEMQGLVERIVARPVDDSKRPPMNGQHATGRPLNPSPSSPA